MGTAFLVATSAKRVDARRYPVATSAKRVDACRYPVATSAKRVDACRYVPRLGASGYVLGRHG
jgi:hypothetical protein